MRERLSETQVRFKNLSTEEIDAYVASGEWDGKAGGYAIQGQAEGLIAWIARAGTLVLPRHQVVTHLSGGDLYLGTELIAGLLGVRVEVSATSVAVRRGRGRAVARAVDAP